MLFSPEEILNELKQSQYWYEKSKITPNTIQYLICPVCGDKKAYAFTKSPMAIVCNRKSTCGASTKITEVLNLKPINYAKKYYSKTDSERPAREYLKARGLSSSLKNLKFKFWPEVRGNAGGAVMFPIGMAQDKKEIYNGRLLNPKPSEGKTHNSGSTTGLFWKHPGINYSALEEPVSICEGVISALSLTEMGHPAIAVLAAGTKPTKLNIPQSWSLRLCFDADVAGINAAKIWKEAYPNAEVIFPDMPKGKRDWNDILLKKRHEAETKAPAKSEPEENDVSYQERLHKSFNADLDTYRLHGKLALARSPYEYCQEYKEGFNSIPGLFEFLPEQSFYFSSFRKRGGEQDVYVTRCGNFTLEVLSFLKDSSIPSRPSFEYLLKIKPPQRQPVEALASPRDLVDARGLRNFLLKRARVTFEGNNAAATAIGAYVTNYPAPEIRPLEHSGYDHISDCYFFEHFGIGRKGELLLPDNNGIFNLGGVTVSPAKISNSICPSQKGISLKQTYDLVVQAWGDTGAAIFAWMVASWFVHIVRKDLGFMPFCLLHGETQAGKSTLATILNNCQSFSGEGRGLSSLNTKTAISRLLATASSHFTSLCEDNKRDDKRKFDWGDTLTWYNHDSDLALKGVFSNDLQVRELKFLTTLMIACNRPPLLSVAERERACFFEFKQDNRNESTTEAFYKLKTTPSSEFARVIQLVLKKRTRFESDWKKEYRQAVQDLVSITNTRILENHAIILGFHRLFAKVFSIDHDITEFIKTTAGINTMNLTNSVGFDPAEHFFETINELPDEKIAHCVMIDKKKKQLCINLPAVEILFKREKWMFSINQSTGDALKEHPAFIANSVRRTFPPPLNEPEKGLKDEKNKKRAWVFDIRKMRLFQ